VSRERPCRGEVWYLDLSPTGAGEVPAVLGLVVSDDRLNQGESGLVVLMQISTVGTTNPLHIRLDPPEAGIQGPRFIKCDTLGTVSINRLTQRVGVVADATLAAVEDRLAAIFGR
jgi:mRNA interferase MazF